MTRTSDQTQILKASNCRPVEPRISDFKDLVCFPSAYPHIVKHHKKDELVGYKIRMRDSTGDFTDLTSVITDLDEAAEVLLESQLNLMINLQEDCREFLPLIYGFWADLPDEDDDEPVPLSEADEADRAQFPHAAFHLVALSQGGSSVRYAVRVRGLRDNLELWSEPKEDLSEARIDLKKRRAIMLAAHDYAGSSLAGEAARLRICKTYSLFEIGDPDREYNEREQKGPGYRRAPHNALSKYPRKKSSDYEMEDYNSALLRM